MDPEERVKRLYKSRTDRMIDGVCGGIAEYVGIDPVLVRVAFVLLVFAGGTGIVIYIIGMLLMPAGSAPAAAVPAGSATGAAPPADGTTAAPSATTAAATPGAGPASPLTGTAAPAAGAASPPTGATDSTARIIGIGFVVLGGILLLGNMGIGWHHWWGLSWSAIAPLLVIAAGIALVLRSPKPGTAPRAAAGAPTGQEAAAGAAQGSTGFAEPPGRLYRARLDRKFLGICGGLGAYLAVDPTILRLLFVISAIASFGGTVLLYLITAIIVPAEPLQARPA
jgi:phage shock protein PspC (stress-responsive transcriptional regulator)